MTIHHLHHFHDPLKIEAVPTAVLSEINCKLQIIMSKISEFADKMATHNNAMDEAVSGLQSDVQTLNAKITELQNTAGEITAEDQALLDQIESRAGNIATKLEALNALTPPTPPTE